MEFPCTGCGECCRRLQSLLEANHEHPILKELVERFPFKTTESGACEMLMEDGSCGCYDQRPILCNVKLGAVVLGVDEDEWFRFNAAACNKLIVNAGLDEKYFVKYPLEK